VGGVLAWNTLKAIAAGGTQLVETSWARNAGFGFIVVGAPVSAFAAFNASLPTFANGAFGTGTCTDSTFRPLANQTS